MPTDVTLSHGGVFVTLRRLNRLRGCIGSLDGTPPIWEAIRAAAASAALRDPRFPPVAASELTELHVHISVLSAPLPWNGIESLVLGRHGIVVEHQGRRGVFLPEVATENNLSREQFVELCCSEKAGLPRAAWRDSNVRVLLFETAAFDG